MCYGSSSRREFPQYSGADYLFLVWKVNAPGRDCSSIGPIVADIKFLVLCVFSVSFVHVSRCANEVAHMLADSSDFAAYSVFWHCVPGCIQDVVNSECFSI